MFKDHGTIATRQPAHTQTKAALRERSTLTAQVRAKAMRRPKQAKSIENTNILKKGGGGAQPGRGNSIENTSILKTSIGKPSKSIENTSIL